MSKKISLINIFFKFLKVGAMTFGGGYSMLPILEREFWGEENGSLSKEELLDYYAVAQSIPGLIGLNVAALIGYKKRGVMGGIIAVLGVITPCIVIITIIAALLGGFRDNIYVRRALNGISICVVALIMSSVIKLWRNSITDIPQFMIFFIALLIAIFSNLSVIFCILGGAICGVIINLIIRRKKS